MIRFFCKISYWNRGGFRICNSERHNPSHRILNAFRYIFSFLISLSTQLLLIKIRSKQNNCFGKFRSFFKHTNRRYWTLEISFTKFDVFARLCFYHFFFCFNSCSKFIVLIFQLLYSTLNSLTHTPTLHFFYNFL